MASVPAGVRQAVPIILVLVVGSVLFLPVSPSISGTFSVQTFTPPGGPSHVEIKLVSASYTKEPLIRSYSAVNGNLSLPIKSAQQGSYTLMLEVKYGNSPLLTQKLGQIGDGTYGFRMIYLWRQEAPNVPYIITITVSGQAIQPASISVTVFPS